MVTKQHGSRPRTFREAQEEVESHRWTCRFCTDHGINALTVLLLGLGVLSFFVRLCRHVLTFGKVIVGGISLSVLAYTIRVYSGGREDLDAADYEDQ
jgi:hypothetical protein